ncbi:MAG: hypothetical protein JJ953_01720 [Gracilimonas sp.]|uniref:hypothetical protein n=1 Tax=Gracilimonas TaxID=649462 RepID=UPI001B077B13|nr:hypothetical protein [Gracilimonas sp.]MBO6584801.1 hypothetical protein [Gracilimonas sp.]MBO6615928.1 hypothetical protein [Gracilimonas sp.]
MKQLVVIIVSVLVPFIGFAQVMDDTDIKKLEKGEYNIEAGKIQVTFSDTVSPTFIEQKLDDLGYEILSSEIKNIVLSIENNPSPQQLKELEESEWVEFVMSEAAGNSDKEMEEINDSDTLGSDKVNQLLAKLTYSKEYEYVVVALTYNATEITVEDIKAAYPDLKFEVLQQSQRSAILKTEEDKELEAMDELKKLDFVKNTAMVGNLE